MTDPELTAAQERAVRDLLASARPEGPVPADVASRLDAALAELVADRAADPVGGSPDRPPPPVSLAARRRRRLATAVLAAAAVVVGAVGIGQVVLGGGSGDDAATTSDLGADHAGGDTESAPQATRPRRSGADAGAAEADQRVRDGRVILTEDSFRDGVRGLAAAGTIDSVSGRTPTCGLEGLGRGRLLAVTYAGDDGVLVSRPARDGRQRVDLYLCGSDAIARTVVLRPR